MEANSVLCSANQSSTCIYRLRFFKQHGKFARYRCEVMFEVVQKSARAQAVWPMSLGKQQCRNCCEKSGTKIHFSTFPQLIDAIPCGEPVRV